MGYRIQGIGCTVGFQRAAFEGVKPDKMYAWVGSPIRFPTLSSCNGKPNGKEHGK